MSSDRAFLLPVVVDQTAEGDDRVPERFREVQWTRLAAGETPPAFTERVRRLLDLPEAPPAAAAVADMPPSPTPPELGATVGPMPNFGARSRWIALSLVVLAGVGITLWASRHAWLHPAAVVPYSSEDRRMTFAVMPFDAPADDPHAVQIAKATAEELVTIFEARPEYVHVASRDSVAQAAAHEVGTKNLAKALDVHFLIRGSVARAAAGYTVTLVTADGDSERVLTSRSLAVAADALTPRWRDDVEEAIYHLTRAGTEIEVKRARDKPLEDLDVRDLTLRAVTEWRTHREKDAKGAYMSATDLLERALVLAPDDPFAIEATAFVNLCDCIDAWSKNPEEQKAIGAAAMERYLRIDPESALMLLDKAQLLQLRGRWEESLVIADSVLRRNPEDGDALQTKAKGLLRLGRAKEGEVIADALELRYPGRYPDLTALVSDIHFVLGDYAKAAELAQTAATQMSEERLRNPIDGSVRLTLIAAEAKLGHLPRAKSALADFTAAVPGVTTIAAMKGWVHPSADLAGFEPLFDAIRLAGVAD